MSVTVPLNELSVSAASAAINAGKLTSEALVLACLEQIERRESEVLAWAFLDPDLALQQARQRDKETPRHRLHGIPVGFKDVLDTCDMPTQYGSAIYAGNHPSSDAACVAQVREAGGVILGKTVSTEFATRHPNITRNPHTPAHTPGGSSSGSAAAVADFMVPIAFGTQTSASTIRPAAYCGVVGYKPTFGLINRGGLKRLSEALDTIGVIARTVPDIALITEELTGLPVTDFNRAKDLKPRIGICRTPYWDRADPASHANLETAARKLAAAGARVSDHDLAAEFALLADAQNTIIGYESSRALAYERTRFPQIISANLMGRLITGAKVTLADFQSALVLARRCRGRINNVFRKYDVLLTLSTPGEAPGMETTGDPIFGVMWTTLHVPCLTLPFGTGPAGLPLGVQVVARHGRDTKLFIHAEWMRSVLR